MTISLAQNRRLCTTTTKTELSDVTDYHRDMRMNTISFRAYITQSASKTPSGSQQITRSVSRTQKMPKMCPQNAEKRREKKNFF